MLRNREFRRFALLFSLLAVVSVLLGFAINTAAGILAAASAAAFGTAFFVFTKARYKSIVQISHEIDLVLHNADHLSIGEADEGELSILHSEITKLLLRIREQNDSLKREKAHLANSLADIAHQLRTPLTSANLILSLLGNTPDEKERKAFVRETEELLVQMDWLLTSLLKLSRLDAGIVVFQNGQIDVATLISAALRPLLIPMELRAIDVQTEVPEALGSLPIKLLSGRLPENSSEVVIPAHVAANGGVKISVGDMLILAVGNRMSGDQTLSQHDPYSAGEETLVPMAEKTCTVVGICWRPAIEEYTAPGYTLITTEDTAATDSLSVFVALKNPYQVHSYADGLSDRYSYVLNDDVLRFMGLSGEKMITVLLYSVVGILIALVMLGSVFLIYNSFNIALNERTHQFGILMSVGATEKQLRNSVLFEGLCIGAMGIPMGILVGIPSIQLVLALVARNFANVVYDNVPLRLVVSLPALVAAVVISTITILISAYIPARKAAGMPVMDCIRQTNEVKVEVKSATTSKLAQCLYGLEEILALKNFQRNRRRYRSIILSLTFSVVLFVSASAFGSYLNQVAAGSAVVSEDYDICFDTLDMDESELFSLYDGLKTADGVTKSAYQALSTYSCVLNTRELSSHFLDEYGPLIGYDGASETVEVQLDVQFVEDSVYQNLLQGLGLSPEEYTGEDEKMIMAGILPGRSYMQEQPMEFTLRSKAGDQLKTIRATFVKDYPDLLPAEPGEWQGYTLMVVAPYGVKAQFDVLGATVKPTKLGMTFQSKHPGRSTAAVQAMIDGASITASYHLYNVYGILEQNRNITFIVNLFSAVFILMISLIAVANVFNTISTNIKLRRREFAMLRSVGMSDRDFNKMMRFECALYGAQTILWGLPLSGIFSYLIYKGMVIGGGTVDYAFPWGSVAISVVGVLFIVFITMLYATRKIRKENIIDALRDHMT